MSDQDIYSGFPQDDEQTIETVLRPSSFKEFVGRHDTVDNLKTWLEAARMRGQLARIAHETLERQHGLIRLERRRREEVIIHE